MSQGSSHHIRWLWFHGKAFGFHDDDVQGSVSPEGYFPHVDRGAHSGLVMNFELCKSSDILVRLQR